MKITDMTECFATQDGDSIIDVIDPATGLGFYGGKSLEDCRKEEPKAERMMLAEHCRRKAVRQRTLITWEETTRERFDEMLNVLPPAWGASIGYKAFLVGETMDHEADTGQPRFSGFRWYCGAFYQSSRPVTVQEMKEEVGKPIN